MTGAATAVRAVSEAAREREAYKYCSFLSSGFRFIRDGGLPHAAELTTATDSILTALAQLGACRVGAQRAFISVFDSSHQYIIAEATPSIRIAPNLASRGSPGSLTLCGTAIPRNQGTCDHVLDLPPNTTLATELPLSFVPNLSADPRFSFKPYYQLGDAGQQFCAAVPIRTRRGIDIGSFCVLNPMIPELWNENCAQVLRDISNAIMDHLELSRCKQESRQHERMNRGMGSFIEGKGTTTGWQSGSNIAAFETRTNLEGLLDAKQQNIEQQEQESRGDQDQPMFDGGHTTSAGDTLAEWSMKGSTMKGSKRPWKSDPAEFAETQQGHTEASEASDANTNNASLVFSKAANIIRESFEVEGSVFLDVTLGSYRQPATSSSEKMTDNDESPGNSYSTSSSDEHPLTAPGETQDEICNLLGFSQSDVSSVNNATRTNTVGNMPKRFLAKLLRRYPKGKIFNFDAIGELQSSDSSGYDGTPKAHHATPHLSRTTTEADITRSRAPKDRRSDRPYSRQREGALIQQAFPSARSVAFVPVWNSKSERWVAGGFIYTFTSTRVFTIQGELSFLMAFSKLIATEVLHIEMLEADKAKSDALGSVSHELRSPLHGIILGTDLLNDTDLTVFQGNATHTIETCCRTMLDTIEHLLDFTKINSFAAKSQHASSTRSPMNRRNSRPDQFGKKSLYKTVRVDGIVEEVVNSVFAGFNFQHISVRQQDRHGDSKYSDIVANKRLDFKQAMEQLDDRAGIRTQLDNISVCVSIDPTSNWLFHAQPGALRRLVMNLVGNSLKYTPRGTISVSLRQEPSKRSTSERLVRLTVQDTGKGIGQEYMRHGLFKPFFQEDELTSGTGLGLSLVKKIVSQSGGRIYVESQVGVGSTFTIILPLEQSRELKAPADVNDDDSQFDEQVRELQGLRVRVSGFTSLGNQDERAVVDDICRRWLGLETVLENEEKVPDVVLWSQDAMPDSLFEVAQLSRTPNIIICRDALAAYQLSAELDNIGDDRVFACISQPIGPRTLARSILLAYNQWVGLRKRSLIRPPVSPRPGGINSEQLPIEGTLSKQSSEETRIQRHKDIERRIADATDDGTFTASRPSVTVHQADVEQEKGSAEPEGNTGESFLLVDDNYINLKVLSAYMRKLGREYATATNGKEALETYVQRPGAFTAIFMDISMPVMNGLEATRRIREHERETQLPPVNIIALTGLASHRTQQEALESGVDVFLTKPVRLDTLQEALRKTEEGSSPATEVT